MYKLCGCMALCMMAVGGCSLGPVKTCDKSIPGVRVLNPYAGPVLVSGTDAVSSQNFLKIPAEFALQSPDSTTVDYIPLPFMFSSLPAVHVKFPNGKTYDAFIDTGFSEFVWVNELVVKDNNLPTYSLGTCAFSNAAAGVCSLPSIKIGNIIMNNPPCRYQQLHWELQVLGVPLWRQHSVLLGLKTLMQFNYVLFDSKNYNVQFANHGNFVPDDPRWWSAYPYFIEPDASNNLRLMVEMPIGAKDRIVMFDTCGGYGLVVHPMVWKQLSTELGYKTLSQGKFISGFQGWLDCRKGRVSKLRIGERTISNAQIVVPDEKTSYLGSVEAVMSMAYFKDTVIVFDNVRHQLWVKNDRPAHRDIVAEKF